MADVESVKSEALRVRIRSIDELLDGAVELERKIKECDESGSHIGEQTFMGPARGRYNPKSNVRCSHCGRVYIGRNPSDGSTNDRADKFLRAAYLML